jgi:hypothetical protein
MYMGNFNRLYGTHFSLVFRIEKKDRLFFLIFTNLDESLKTTYTQSKSRLYFFSFPTVTTYIWSKKTTLHLKIQRH